MTLQGRRIAILAADGVERVELVQPRDAQQQAGGQIDILSLRRGGGRSEPDHQPFTKRPVSLLFNGRAATRPSVSRFVPLATDF